MGKILFKFSFYNIPHFQAAEIQTPCKSWCYFYWVYSTEPQLVGQLWQCIPLYMSSTFYKYQ